MGKDGSETFHEYITVSAASNLWRYKQKAKKTKVSAAKAVVIDFRKSRNPPGTTFRDNDVSSLRVSNDSLATDITSLRDAYTGLRGEHDAETAAVLSLQFNGLVRALQERLLRKEVTDRTPFTTRMNETLPEGWRYHFIMQTKFGTWRFRRLVDGKQISEIRNTLDEVLNLRRERILIGIPADVTPLSGFTPSPLLALFIAIAGMARRSEDVTDDLAIFNERFRRAAYPPKYSVSERKALRERIFKLTSSKHLFMRKGELTDEYVQKYHEYKADAQMAAKLDAADAAYEALDLAYRRKKHVPC